MLANRRVNQQRLRMLRRNRILQLREEKTVIQMELLLIFRAQRRVRIDDRHQFHVLLLGKALQKPGHVPVLQPYNRHAHRLLCLRRTP